MGEVLPVQTVTGPLCSPLESGGRAKGPGDARTKDGCHRHLENHKRLEAGRLLKAVSGRPCNLVRKGELDPRLFLPDACVAMTFLNKQSVSYSLKESLIQWSHHWMSSCGN